MLPLDLTAWFDTKLSTTRYGKDVINDEKPLAAFDDWESLALTIPEISHESSGPIITSLLTKTPGVSTNFCLMRASIFLETTWKLPTLFSAAYFSFMLFLNNEIFFPIIWLPPDSCLIRSNEWKFNFDSKLTSAELADKLVSLSLTMITLDSSSTALE